MKELVILGAGDLGKEVIWLIEDINRVSPKYTILGLLDDDRNKYGTQIHGYQVMGDINRLTYISRTRTVYAVIAIEDGSIRNKIVNQVRGFKKWETLIHPSAVISDMSTVGEGSIIFANVTVSVDTSIGKHCLCYLSSTIGNDCEIGDYVSVMSKVTISEHVKVGNQSYLSASSIMFPNREIGEAVKIGVGAVVSKNMKDSAVLAGGVSGLNFFR